MESSEEVAEKWAEITQREGDTPSTGDDDAAEEQGALTTQSSDAAQILLIS